MSETPCFVDHASDAGKGHIVSGLSNKLQVAAAGVVPQSVLADRHRKMAEPGSDEN